MGINEDLDIAHYKLPVQIHFTYDGTDILNVRVRIDLQNIAGENLRSFKQELVLTEGQKDTLKGVLDAKLAAFEAATGWTDIDA